MSHQPPQTPHKTPLRRVSQGSLFAISRSGAYPDAPHGLGFLEPAMTEFTDEIDTLQSNIENMKRLSDSLGVFNESFASWLYIMDMNALTVDWPQAPNDASFYLARRRAGIQCFLVCYRDQRFKQRTVSAFRIERDALAAMEAMRRKTAPPPPPIEKEKTLDPDSIAAEGTTSNATTSKQGAGKTATVPKKGPVKGGKKPKMTAKERKERNLEIEKIASYLPLEFRGSDPVKLLKQYPILYQLLTTCFLHQGLRRNLDAVVEGLMDAPGQTVKKRAGIHSLLVTDLVKPPDLPQNRVNKCLIALINRKIVLKDNSTGQVLYHWQGVTS
ncbi:hypothetical protein L218DRAFT_983207 [Marasmius fiardii PR-910]|nr:hypothetical protein L218DRAFT_983207 [Marasmius fiardii PR-910]